MAVLHKGYSLKSDDSKDIYEIDKDIRNYIKQNKEENFNRTIANDARWQIFYHLSEMRKSILNWYDFKENAELLEIGGDFGALTGLFCDKCLNVTTVEYNSYRAEAIYERYSDRENLEIYADEIKNIKFNKKFDYITVIGAFEYHGRGSTSKDVYIDILKQISSLLKPNGKILLAVENRYGLKYFCGAEEPHTHRPFDGINQYPFGTNGYSFSRQELIDIIDSAGLNHKFYYPLPDYKLPQIIYSENYLPQRSFQFNERVIPYYLHLNTLVAVENDLYGDLIDNNVFEFFSNSFLVECSFDNNFSPVVYAALSTDRGYKHSFSTAIINNGTVFKKPLYSDGIVNLQKIYDNIIDLEKHGIKTVPHKLENNILKLPYIKDKLLSDYLRDIIKTDKEQFLKLIDKLYECILISSEHVPREYNTFKNTDNSGLDFGIILRKAYIDMVPVNCFFIDGELVFFDQEFVMENYPAKYILFRALKYTYLSSSGLEKIIPIEILKQKYELTKLWNLFDEKEQSFVEDNRNYDIYKHYISWSWVDINHVYKNADLLMGM